MKKIAVKQPWDQIKREFDPSTVGVLLTSHPRQQMFWDKGLSCWNDSPFFVLLGYDDVDDSKIKDHVAEYNGVKQIFCTGQRSGHVGGELLQFQMGSKILSDMRFRYFLKLAADYEINPEEIWRLHEALERVTFSEVLKPPRLVETGSQMLQIGTVLVFGFTDIIYAMMKPMKMGHPYGAAERYFTRQRLNLNISRASYPHELGPKKGLEHDLGIHHVQGQYAYDEGITVLDTWERGEIWK